MCVASCINNGQGAYDEVGSLVMQGDGIKLSS